MINNYIEYNTKLILESVLNVDANFLNKLKKIEKNSIITNILSKIDMSTWIDSSMNQDYFSTSDSNDKVTFINPNRVRPSDDPYTLKGRSDVKIGRAIKYICNLYDIKSTPKDIEDIVNLYKSIEVDSNKFKLLIGDDIKYGYNTDNYSSDRGQLGDSCMNDEFSYLKIYINNDKKVRLLILEDEYGVVGRAIIWKLDKSPCESEYFMDRVYTNEDYQVDIFREYARKNNWMYKRRMSYGVDEAVYFIYKDKSILGEIRVILDGDIKKYPFLDTLAFLGRDKNELSNIPSRKCFILHDTEGERDRCSECLGKATNAKLCDECCIGVYVLNGEGIETNVERNRKESK